MRPIWLCAVGHRRNPSCQSQLRHQMASKPHRLCHSEAGRRFPQGRVRRGMKADRVVDCLATKPRDNDASAECPCRPWNFCTRDDRQIGAADGYRPAARAQSTGGFGANSGRSRSDSSRRAGRPQATSTLDPLTSTRDIQSPATNVRNPPQSLCRLAHLCGIIIPHGDGGGVV